MDAEYGFAPLSRVSLDIAMYHMHCSTSDQIIEIRNVKGKGVAKKKGCCDRRRQSVGNTFLSNY
jgi:hypothetical protein